MKFDPGSTTKSPMARKPKKNHPWRNTMVVPSDPSKLYLPLRVDGNNFKHGTTRKNRHQ